MACCRLEEEITDPLLIIAAYTVMDSCGFMHVIFSVLMWPLSIKFTGASCMHALRLETIELPKNSRKLSVSAVHL